jgi:hypothetical protein
MRAIFLFIAVLRFSALAAEASGTLLVLRFCDCVGVIFLIARQSHLLVRYRSGSSCLGHLFYLESAIILFRVIVSFIRETLTNNIMEKYQ